MIERTMNQILQGDCREVLKHFADQTFHMCVTSPPYWGLRSYSGNQDLIWGGDPDCRHEFLIETAPPRKRSDKDVIDHKSKQHTAKGSNYNSAKGKFCIHCNAWSGPFGLEPTIEMFIDHTVQIFREVWRVLRNDGTLWINIADSYATKGSGSGQNNSKIGDGEAVKGFRHNRYLNQKNPCTTIGNIKPKDLCLVPDRLRIALQDDGWYVRSKIVWHKTNPMPESCRDRPTKAHEDVILLTKSGKNLYWTHPSKKGVREKPAPAYYWKHKNTDQILQYPPVSDRLIKKFWKRKNAWTGHDYFYDGEAIAEDCVTNHRDGRSSVKKIDDWNLPPPNNKKNKRNVWTLATKGYSGAHFATFPEELIEPCIKAGTSEYGVCPKCLNPWERLIEKTDSIIERTDWAENSGNRTAPSGTMVRFAESITIGWQPTCDCGLKAIPALVLDPFGGADTTGVVSKKLGRSSISIELSGEYCDIGDKRRNESP